MQKSMKKEISELKKFVVGWQFDAKAESGECSCCNYKKNIESVLNAEEIRIKVVAFIKLDKKFV